MQSQLEEAKTHKDTLGPLWGTVEAHFISLVLREQKKKKIPKPKRKESLSFFPQPPAKSLILARI